MGLAVPGLIVLIVKVAVLDPLIIIYKTVSLFSMSHARTLCSPYSKRAFKDVDAPFLSFYLYFVY